MVDSSGDDQPRSDSLRDELGNERQRDRPTAERASKTRASELFAGGTGMLQFAGAGLELGGSAILCAAIGYALDQYFENTTLVATALGAVIGFAAGLYRFIRMAMAANRSAGRR